MKMQLFLLHFAGGSCYSFDFLKQHLDSRFEFIPLELPGRGRRTNENLLNNKEKAINDYLAQIKLIRNGEPYVIYGHSMGATLGLSIAEKMELLADPPLGLIVSGNAGPETNFFGEGFKKTSKKSIHLMEDEQFKTELRRLGGVSEEILSESELFDFFSPIIRADFQILENSKFLEKDISLSLPIYAVMGDQEEKVNNITSWEKFTKSDFKHWIFSGNHFFIHRKVKELSNIINKFSETGVIS